MPAVVRLLLIEDDPTIRMPLIRALGERGHAIAAASTALGGLQTALDERPDLVLLDLGLPDLDGIELLRMLRAVIFLTGDHRDCQGRRGCWTVLAEDTGRAVTLDVAVTGPMPVGVAADELAAALDALLGNVFAHTPDGTAFAVTLTARIGGGATLTLADDGPGLAADQVRRGASSGGSTGLGLDIARRVAQSSGGRESVNDDRGGDDRSGATDDPTGTDDHRGKGDDHSGTDDHRGGTDDNDDDTHGRNRH